jgi:hypothetical protein
LEFVRISEITNPTKIATGHGIKLLGYLNTKYGRTNWRKMKGICDVELENGEQWLAEIHWFEGHGIGKVDFRIKQQLERLF